MASPKSTLATVRTGMMTCPKRVTFPVPFNTAAALCVLLDSPLGVTIARVGFGAFPLGCAIFTFSCLVSSRRLLTGLAFVGNMMGLVLGVRILGILVDGTARENMRLVGAEILL